MFRAKKIWAGKGNSLVILLIFSMVTSWIYSAWPQIKIEFSGEQFSGKLVLPPEVEKVEASPATTTIEQQINIIDQEFFTMDPEAWVPDNNSLGIIKFDPSKYSSSTTLYFEAIIRTAPTYSWERHRSSEISPPTSAKEYTVRITGTNLGGCAAFYYEARAQLYNITDQTEVTTVENDDCSTVGASARIKAARLIIVQSADPYITDTQTQIEVGDNSSTTATAYTDLIDKKIYLYDQDKFNPTSTAYFEATLKTATAVTGAMIVYGDNNATGTPRYRIWNGLSWGDELDAQSVGSSAIYWVVVRACPERDEYVVVTVDSNAVVKAQVFSNGSWGSLQTIATLPAFARGVDIAYETNSGDAIVVAADGDADPTWYSWNGSSWNASGTVDLSTEGTAGWIAMDSDPTSDEIILIAQDTDYRYYRAQVWNGSSWGNEFSAGTVTAPGLVEGMAVKYETSGNQAIIVYANDTNSSFYWNSWNGSNWGTAVTVAIGDDFMWGTLKADPNSDKLLLAYVDTDVDPGKVYWGGDSWTDFFEVSRAAKADTSRCIDSEFETITGHTGHALVVYSDTGDVMSRQALDPSGDTWYTEISANIQDSSIVQTRRTGDGKIMVVAFDDVNTQYDFSYFNGSSWSAAQTLENEPSSLGGSIIEPFMIAPQLYSRTPTAYAALYMTDGTYVTGSEVSTSSTSWGRVRTALSITLSDDIEYVVRIKATSTSIAYIANAKIILTQASSTGIDALETVHQYVNTKIDVVGSSGYATTTFYNEYNPDNWAGGSFAHYFEATMKVPSDGLIYADLISPEGTIAGSEIVATTTSYERERSIDTLSMPTSATTTDTRGFGVAGTSQISNSWLIIQASGLVVVGPTVTCTTPLATTIFGTVDDQLIYTSSPDATTTITTDNTNGFTMKVYDLGSDYADPGLYKSSGPTDLIGSADASYNSTSTLQAGIEGYGIQATTSGSNVNIDPRFLWATSTDDVGGLEASSTNAVVLASSSAAVTSQVMTITHKAAVSSNNKAGDYSDTIIYSCTVNP